MSRTGIVALALWAWCASAPPAQAQFYSLEGRFECLNDPKTVCFDATPDGPMARPSASAARTAAAGAARKPQGEPVRVAPRVVQKVELIREIAKRLEARHPAPDDTAALRRLAEAGDKRALELLAWCTHEGVGVRRDPLQSYLLYGIAADVGVADARRNQAVIYEYDLTSDQRQQVLTIENGVTRARAEWPAAGSHAVQ